MDLGIKGKVALVAAASRGLGKAVAQRLAAEGARVVICARSEENLQKARLEIEETTGASVLTFTADVADETQARAFVDFGMESLGAVHILVCNAGGPPSGFAEDFKPDDYRRAVELNLLSTIGLCYAAVPVMKKQGWGRLIPIASVSAKQPIDSLILSNTARAGVLGFAKSLSAQLAPYGITVNTVCPGYTRTERVEELAASFARSGKGTVEDFFSRVQENIPMNRLGRPEEFAHAVAFLASEGAGYITGIALQIDGGFIKGLI